MVHRTATSEEADITFYSVQSLSPLLGNSGRKRMQGLDWKRGKEAKGRFKQLLIKKSGEM